jgi:GT2 family glycosyltransferase
VIAATNLSAIPKKTVKLFKVWQERGTGGLLRFLHRRLREQWRGKMTYDRWVVEHRLTPASIRRAQQQMAQWQIRPLFSVILPVYNVDAIWLEKAIQSVLAQIYPDWELCIADDASSKSHIKPLLERYSKLDSRIKVCFRPENGNIVAASNSALELATGDYIALLDHDDELAPDALFENAKLINQHPDADFIYSDEDKIDTRGRRSGAFFKPDWSPDYFHACMYTCHLGVYRTRLIREMGGFRPGYDGSQDYDLVLRVVEKTQHIYHISKILYHWRIIPSSVTTGEQAKPWAYAAARRSLEAMLERSPYPGWVEETERAGFWRVRRHIVGKPLISIVIPSAGRILENGGRSLNVLENCIQSIYQQSTYRHFEIIVVDGYDIPEPTLTWLQQFPQEAGSPEIRLVRCSEPFNFAHRINQGTAAATGNLLLLLNDDTEVLSPDWLESMVEFAQQAEIGAVGAKLLYPDRTIQHVGVMVLEGNAGHAFHRADGAHPGYFCSNVVNRNYLAVTAACLMVRRQVFEQVGGMDEMFPLNYNDVDLCLKFHQAGYRNVVTPYAQLLHYESVSRDGELKPKEWENLNQKWDSYLKKLGYDPYYNPNLSYREANFELY